MINPNFTVNVSYESELPDKSGFKCAWLITIKATKRNKHGTKPVYWKVTKTKPTAKQIRKCVKAFSKFNNQ